MTVKKRKEKEIQYIIFSFDFFPRKTNINRLILNLTHAHTTLTISLSHTHTLNTQSYPYRALCSLSNLPTLKLFLFCKLLMLPSHEFFSHSNFNGLMNNIFRQVFAFRVK